MGFRFRQHGFVKCLGEAARAGDVGDAWRVNVGHGHGLLLFWFGIAPEREY